jgi:hypothetical protein
MLDIPGSLEAARTIPFEKKACYRNALLTMLSLEAYQSGWYVEGFAIPTIKGIRIPMEHGWVQIKDNRIIDPSFAVLGYTEVAYFPAIKLTWNKGIQLILKNSRLPYMLSHRTKHNRAAYLKALSDAYQAVCANGCGHLLMRKIATTSNIPHNVSYKTRLFLTFDTGGEVKGRLDLIQ